MGIILHLLGFFVNFPLVYSYWKHQKKLLLITLFLTKNINKFFKMCYNMELIYDNITVNTMLVLGSNWDGCHTENLL